MRKQKIILLSVILTVRITVTEMLLFLFLCFRLKELFFHLLSHAFLLLFKDMTGFLILFTLVPQT